MYAKKKRLLFSLLPFSLLAAAVVVHVSHVSPVVVVAHVDQGGHVNYESIDSYHMNSNEA